MSGERRRAIVLVGLMATGKSTVGRLLAARVGRPYWDSDDILRDAGESAAAIARARGADALHRLEAENLRRALDAGEAGVLGAAAAVVLEPGIAAALRPHWVVWLRASAPAIAARIAAAPDDRPFLDGDVPRLIAEMSRARAPLYAAVADLIVRVDGRSPEEIAAIIDASLPADLRES